MLTSAMMLATSALGAKTAPEASGQFYAALHGLGASYLQTRLYRRPTGALTSKRHYAAGGLVTRIAPERWRLGMPAFDYVCFECNPLLEPIRAGRTRYRFSDFAGRSQPRFGRYWDALGEAKIDEALCATSYGPDNSIASLHLGFTRRDFTEAEAFSIQLAGLMLTERLMSLAELAPAEEIRLSARERDCLSWVAEGKSDWEISVILGVSESTVRWHVDNARRKLGAVNRAQAVARLAAARLL